MLELLALLIPMVLLLVFSGLASGSETALFSMTHTDRDRLRAQHPGAGAAVDKLLASPRALLVFILLLNMSVNVTYFVLSSLATTRASGPAAALVGLGSVLGIVLFGEIFAKLVAGPGRVAFCRVLAVPMMAVRGALLPVLSVIDHGAIAPLARLVAPSGPGLGPSEDELTRLVASGGRAGHLDPLEHRLLRRVIDLGGTRVRDVMTPRVDLAWCEADATPAAFVAAARDAGVHALPLGRKSLDRGIVGVLDARRVAAAAPPGSGRRVRLEALAERPLYVPETARLDAALELLRANAAASAFCVDEQGELTGRLDLADIADELLAGLAENTGPQQQAARLIGLGVWLVPGRLALRDFAEAFGLARPDVAHLDASTLAGMISETLGRVPTPGDAVALPGLRVVVETVHRRAADRVRVELVSRAGAAEPGNGSGDGVSGGVSGGEAAGPGVTEPGVTGPSVAGPGVAGPGVAGPGIAGAGDATGGVSP